MGKRVIIGLGTGRCGTTTLAALLRELDINATHEHSRVPWEFNEEIIDRVMTIVSKRKGNVVSDTAFYYLPYVEYLMENIDKFPKVDEFKFVCLQRPMKDTVVSYVKHTRGRNHWCDDGISRRDERWDDCYPTYKSRSKEVAIRLYWREYYRISKKLQKKYPDNFKLYSMHEALNTKDGQDDMFAFMGLSLERNLLNIVRNKAGQGKNAGIKPKDKGYIQLSRDASENIK